MCEIQVIGELRVRLGGTRAELPAGRRARALLAWLALHPGRHPRSRLAGLFWPDVLDASARASLRSAIWALRSALGPAFAGYLGTDRDTVTLAGADLRVDLWEVRRLIADGEPEAALALCHAELLQELDDDWVLDAREELDRDMAAALRELADRARAAGDWASALSWARRRAALGRLEESATAGLIQILIEAGDAPAALEEFARLEQRLGSELGVRVSAATAALVEPLSVAAGAPGVSPDGGPGVSPDGGPGVSPDGRPGVSRDGGPAQPAGRVPGRAAGFVGREQELAGLVAAWRAASAAGRAVLLEGEGGIGKTRLIEELQAAVRRAGARGGAPGPAARMPACVTASAAGPGPAAPFGIWADALGDLVAETGPPPAGEPWTATLARIVPALASRADGRPSGRLAADPQLERVRLCEAVVQFLIWASRPAPLLLAMEDLHAADAASLELIAYAGRRLNRLPVLLVLTRRLEPGRRDLDAVLAALRSRRALATAIRLGPLPDDAARALIRETADVPETVVSEIAQCAAGRPLLAVETARAAAEGGLVAGLAGAVRIAVSRLSGPARTFVEFAAVAGRGLDRAEVASLPLPSPARAATEALGSGLLQTDDGRTGFRHALLADAVYQDIADPVRARLHGALAQLLRTRARPARKGSRTAQAAEIARHLRAAGQDDQAVNYLVMVAHGARNVAAMAEAASFLTEALQIDPDDPDLLIELAEVSAFRGLPGESDEAFGRALELIAPQDAGALISAWLRRGRWLRGGVCHPRESRRSYQNALDVLDRDPDADLPARAEALAGLAWAEAVAGTPAAVGELLAEADRSLGGRRPCDLLAHDIGVARGHALIRAGQFTASFGPLIAASAAAGRAARPDMAYSCLSNAACAAACAGEFGRALDFADRCLPLVVPNGLLRLSVYAQTARSAILRRLDRLPEARRACDAAAGYADRIGLPELDGLVHAERGLVAAAAAQPRAAVAELTSALDLGAPVSRAATRLRLAEALARAGQPDQAEAELRAVALEPVGPGDFPAALVAQMSRVQGRIAAARGDVVLAGRYLSESLASWQRIAGTPDSRQAGAGYVAGLIDLGRPPVSSLVEPARELAAVGVELAALRAGAVTPAGSEPGAAATAPARTGPHHGRQE